MFDRTHRLQVAGTFLRSINRETVRKALLHVRQFGLSAFLDNMRYRIHLKMQNWHGSILKNTIFSGVTCAGRSLQLPLMGSFRFLVSGLCRMSFRLDADSPIKTGAVRLILTDESGVVLRRAIARVAKLHHDPHLLFNFQQLPDSMDRYYRFCLEGLAPPWPILQYAYSGPNTEILLDEQGTVSCTAMSDDWKGSAYDLWQMKREPSPETLKQEGKISMEWLEDQNSFFPCISIIVPLFNTPENMLREMIDSMLRQTWPKWELCLADGSTNGDAVERVVQSYATRDARILYKRLSENGGIAGNTNAAADLATGEFIGLLDHDDTLAPFALFEVVSVIRNGKGVDLVYSDEDKMSEDAKHRFDPHFKTDWSPDLLRSCNYITHFSVLKKTLFDDIGRYRPGYDGSQDYDLLLRATEQARNIVHIPKILYHWRVFHGSTALSIEAKPYAVESAKRALRNHLARISQVGKVDSTFSLTLYRCKYEIIGTPLVSVIIPNRDSAEVLSRCINSILMKSTWKHFEIIILIKSGTGEEDTVPLDKSVFKGPRVRVETWNGSSHYAAIRNFGVEKAKGEVLLFLDSDTEVMNADWIESMLEHAQRSETGAVGAKLHYRNGTLQHCGIVLGFNGVAEQLGQGLPKTHSGYMGRSKIVQNLSAVTGACVMVRREIFEKVGGFDETFPASNNDVDLCLRIRKAGFWIVWTPFAELFHDEDKTRILGHTQEEKASLIQERERFHDKWGVPPELRDPFYNPNFTLEGEPYDIDA